MDLGTLILMLFCCIYRICLFGKHCELGLAHKLACQKWQHANHLCADIVSGTAHAEAKRKQICRQLRHNRILYHLIMSMQGNISRMLEDLGTSQQEGWAMSKVLEKVQESATNDERNQNFGKSHCGHSDRA